MDRQWSGESTLSGDGGVTSILGVAPTPGRSWGKFLIERQLGGGGEAVVFQAYDRAGAAGHVALKVAIRPAAGQDATIRAATGTEPLTRLKHPNIVPVVEAGVVDGVPYIATPLIEGLPLNAWCEQREAGTRRVLAWLIALAGAVRHAHEGGVVHRDIKPPNVIITAEGKPVLIDFGIADIVTPYQSERAPGVSGTFLYMAPEQARGGGKADHRVDVFGLGVLLKFLLVGEGPYPQAQTVREAYDAARSGEVALIDTHGLTGLRRSLALVANRALAPAPEDRYRNAADLLRALRRLARRRSVLAGGLLGTALAGAAAVAVMLAWPARGPVTASLTVHFQRQGQEGSFSILTPEHLPLVAGDRIQVHAHFSAPCAAYLLALTSTQKPFLLFPPEGESSRVGVELHVPSDANEWLPLTETGRRETIMLLLLARRAPIVDAAGLVGRVAAAGPPPGIDDADLLIGGREGLSVTRGQKSRAVGLGPVRAAKGFVERLDQQFEHEWDMIRVFAFPQCPAGGD